MGDKQREGEVSSSLSFKVLGRDGEAQNFDIIILRLRSRVRDQTGLWYGTNFQKQKCYHTEPYTHGLLIPSMANLGPYR